MRTIANILHIFAIAQKTLKMEKTKLSELRKSKGFSQQQVADKLCMDVSNYNRRESGHSKISHNEWEKLSKLLGVSVEDIYENEDSMIFICKDQAVGIVNGNNHIYSIPEYFLENQRKYIEKLEEENATLKAELAIFRNKLITGKSYKFNTNQLFLYYENGCQHSKYIPQTLVLGYGS